MREEGTGRRSSKTGVKTEPAMTFSVVEEATIASAGDNRACSDRRSRKDECSDIEGNKTEYGGSF